MVILAFRKRRQFQGVGSLVELFYRDGIFYFIALGSERIYVMRSQFLTTELIHASALATANIIFEYTAPVSIQKLSPLPMDHVD